MKTLLKITRCLKAGKRLKHSLNLKGIYPPITTPFDQHLNLHTQKLEENLKKWNQLAFKGYVVFGSNGEYKSLEEAEKIEIIKLVKRVASKDKFIVVGTGCESSRATIDLTNKLADHGAQAALVINPSYYKSQMNNKSFFDYYTQVADLSKIPIIIYNMPLFTGIDIDAQLIVQLSQHPNIVGVKESTSNIAKISEMAAMCGENFHVFAGSADYLLPSLLMGASGGICASANILGKEIIKMFDLFHEGKMEACVELQRKLLLPNKAVTKMYSVPGLKQTMDWMGFYGGPCRSPLLPLDDSQAAILKDIFSTHRYI